MAGPTPMTERTAAEERLWARVDRSRDTDDCWLWRGPVHASGYGEIRGDDHQWVGVHRLAYELRRGPIPDGLTIDHLCRQRNCINPAHLEAVTSRENTLRGNNPMARNARRKRCKHGHPFDEDNTYHTPPSAKYPHGRRVCRACRRAQD